MYDPLNQALPLHPKQEKEYPGAVCAGEIKKIFCRCADFESRTLRLGAEGQIELLVCYLDGLIAGRQAAEDVLRPLYAVSPRLESEKDALLRLLAGAAPCPSVSLRRDLDSLSDDLTHGRFALVFDSLGCALSFDVRSNEARAVGEPTLEKSLKGSKDSFVETLRANTALVRRHVATPRLKIAESALGRKSHTRVAVLFLEGVADGATVRELALRLDRIDVDSLASLGVLEEKLADRPFSPFPQLLHTEKPDRLARYLLDGRIGILVDGIPIALVLPVSFAEFMKVTGDSCMNYLIVSLLTALRYVALILGLYLPALYAAVSSFHQEMLPTRLLLSIIEAKKDVPFSTGAELVLMLLAFALLQEAGLRLPNPVGDTVSIIGALIVGQAAVEARLVSPIAIIVVAVSGIACYTMPSQDMGSAVRLCRTILLFAGIFAGLYGITLASCLLASHLASLDSFGRNYTAPLSGEQGAGLLKLLLVPPLFAQKERDPLLRTPDRRRQR